MAEKQGRSPSATEVELIDVRLAFPSLHAPKAAVEGGKELYRAIFLIDPETDRGDENYRKVKKAMTAAAKETFGDRWKDVLQDLPKGRKAVMKGESHKSAETGEIWDGFEGMIAVSANAGDQPLLIDRKKRAIPQDKIRRTLYGGCRVCGIVRFYCTKGRDKGGPGLFATIEGVRFFGDDDAFGRGGISASAFSDLEDDDVDDDDMDDEDDAPRSRRRRNRDEDDEDEPPARSRRRSRDEDDEDEPPARSRRRSRDEDDEDEPPARSRRRSRDEDDEDEPPARSRRRSRDEDDEDEPPARSRRRSRDEDDEDEPPARSRRRSRDEDDEDDEPPSKRRSAGRRRSRDDDDDDIM